MHFLYTLSAGDFKFLFVAKILFLKIYASKAFSLQRMNPFYILTFVLVFYPLNSIATLSKSDRKNNRQEKKLKPDNKISSEAFSREYIGNSSITYRSIVEEHKSFSVTQAMLRHFHNDVLGYVTPWNNHGYDVAKLFTSKFTMISPVWLQLQPEISSGTVSIGGLHDIDQNWINSLRKLNRNIKIVPRIIFEQWTFHSLKRLFETKVAVEDVASKMINVAKERDFNGYVVEIWNVLGGQMKREVTKFLIDLSSAFKLQKLDLILVIPPPFYFGGKKGMFLREDFKNLVNHVTAFSLMTYDYSSFQRPGPNSPLPWLLQCVEDLAPGISNDHRKKILLGLNFYGYDYSKISSKPIIGHEYISLLENFRPKFTFDNISGEHSFKYRSDNQDHQVYYPTLYSIELRLQLAKELGTSISIWEIGQGLDYFYDLL